LKSSQLIRRLAVRLFGEGPRTLARGSAGRLGAELLASSEGVEFAAPAVAEVTSNLSFAVSQWPSQTRREPSVDVWRMQTAGIYGEDGVIYDRRTRQALQETTIYWRREPRQHPVFELPRAKPVQHFPGRSIFLGGLGGQTFYHFLIENLPKLSALAPSLQDADRIVVQRYIEPTKEAWLRHAGCQLPIQWLQSLEHFTFDEVIFCAPIVADCRPGPGVLRRLREVARGHESAQRKNRTRCIWATRLAAHARPVKWEQRLIDNLPAGWEVVDFAKLTPLEAIEMGREIRFFAGLHGAAFSNLGLWESGIKVIEVYATKEPPWYPTISMSAGHEHFVKFAKDETAIPGILEAIQAMGDR
jgi:capsular polysaccharide biosynthesis protein